MTGTTTAPLCLGSLFFLFSCAVKPPSATAVIVRLDDVQGLYGGQTLVIDADGNVFARKVTPTRGGLRERQYHLKLSPGELNQLFAVIPSSGIGAHHETKRFGVPDEARPRITLALPGHRKVVVEKWANDKDPHFNEVYNILLQIVDKAGRKYPYRKQPYNENSKFPVGI